MYMCTICAVVHSKGSASQVHFLHLKAAAEPASKTLYFNYKLTMGSAQKNSVLECNTPSSKSYRT
jgi:hypothetical protein